VKCHTSSSALLAYLLAASTASSSTLAAAAASTPTTDEPLSAALGAGTWIHPRFPGSNSIYAEPLPYFDVRYENLFLRTAEGLGAYLFHSHGAWAALSIAQELRQRHESDDERLRGLGDVRRTARTHFQAGYAAEFFTAKADVATDIAHRSQGTIVDLTLAAHRAVLGRLEVESGVAAQWANTLFNDSFYGVTASQHVAAGLPEYSPGSGLDELRVFLGARIPFARQWLAVGRVAGVHLARKPADSPITEQQNGLELQAFAAYRC
jgi:outer membrane scaffolding protein for murein synthesis (MipA/OmpV family)